MSDDDGSSSFLFIFFLGVITVVGVLYLFEPDLNWNPFRPSDKTERWIDLDNDRGGHYTKSLNANWANSIRNGLDVKGKMRKSLNTADNRYDFAFKVDAVLTQPRLEAELENKIVDSYKFDFTFFFIDEDGFIMHKIKPSEFFSLEHEKYDNSVEWKNDKYSREVIKVKSQAIFKNMIPEEIVKRVSKISYALTLKAEIEDKESEPNVFEKRAKEFNWGMYKDDSKTEFEKIESIGIKQ